MKLKMGLFSSLTW
uniref:Uncharacterized protein n=1 Tax=Anguilla anguilla TaxID=7936 RepID=A0A0E9TJ19_ANGAN